MSGKKGPTEINGFSALVLRYYFATVLHNTDLEPTDVQGDVLTLMVWERGTEVLVATITFESPMLNGVSIADLHLNYSENQGYYLVLPNGHYVSGKVD